MKLLDYMKLQSKICRLQSKNQFKIIPMRTLPSNTIPIEQKDSPQSVLYECDKFRMNISFHY